VAMVLRLQVQTMDLELQWQPGYYSMLILIDLIAVIAICVMTFVIAAGVFGLLEYLDYA